MPLKEKLYEYIMSQQTASDTDRLKTAIAEAPVGTDLTVSAMTYSDLQTRYTTAELHAVKTESGWEIMQHWFHPKNAVVPNNLIMHDLTWLLHARSVTINCTEPAA